MPEQQATASAGSPPPPAYASIKTWCGMSGMSRATVYRLANRGDLQLVKLHARSLVDVAHGLAFMRRLPAYRPN